MRYDWTNSPNSFGFTMADYSKDSFVTFQVSPDGKWIKLFITAVPGDTEAEGLWLTMYVVQEGDEFTDKDGNILTDVKPGDIYRTTYEGRHDPYECDQTKIMFSYIARKVAVIDEKTGEITVNSPYYEKLVESATIEPPQDIVDATEGLTNDSSMTIEERWDFQVKYLCNTQKYLSSPAPPSGDVIENIGVTASPPKGWCPIKKCHNNSS